MKRTEFAAALLAEVIGAAAALLVATREWQTITTARPRPFTADVLAVSGRTVDAAPTALALVALAGVVAVLATKGTVRRIVGGLVAVAGVGIIVRAIGAAGAVSASRARALVRDKHPRVADAALSQHVANHSVWALLSIVAGALVVIAGALVAGRGGRWSAMSSRYEAPARVDDDDPERARIKADASLWAALERGEDPTARDPRDTH
jgi:uncharacterized membrane protein (TIGR02234 family)